MIGEVSFSKGEITAFNSTEKNITKNKVNEVKSDEYIPTYNHQNKEINTEKTKSNFSDEFNMDEFQSKIKNKLLEMVGLTDKQDFKDLWGVQFKDLEEGTEASNVPEFWNAENTSDRIVDFAMSFSSMFEGKNNEFITKMRDAIVEGFKQAKDMFEGIDGPAKKLFNDTFQMTMEKLDKLQAEDSKENMQPINMVA